MDYMEKINRVLLVVIAFLWTLLIGSQLGLYQGRKLEAEKWQRELAIRSAQIEHLKKRVRKLEKELKVKKLIKKIVQCESSGRHSVWGDGGRSYGIAQFQRRTFEWLKAKAGMRWLNWKNKEHQLILLEWALRNGYGRLWTCYHRVKREG